MAAENNSPRIVPQARVAKAETAMLLAGKDYHPVIQPSMNEYVVGLPGRFLNSIAVTTGRISLRYKRR